MANHNQKHQVLGVSFVQAVQYFVFGSVEFFLVGYLTDVVKLDLFSVGIITGSEIVALVVARPLIGRISDRIGRTKPIIAGIVASCILVAAIPFTTQFPVLLLLAVAYGVSFATVLSSTSPWFATWCQPHLWVLQWGSSQPQWILDKRLDQ